MSARCALALSAFALTACGLNQEGVPPPRDRIVYPSSAYLDGLGRWLYVANSNSDLRYNNGTLLAVDLDKVLADERATEASPPDAGVAASATGAGADGGAMPSWAVCPKPDYVRSYDYAADETTLDNYGIGRCCWDYLDHTVLDCDERSYVNVASTIEIGSFAAGIAFQPFVDKDDCYVTNARHACKAPECLGADGGAGDGGADAAGNDGAASPGAVGVVGGRLFIGVRGNSSITYVDTASNPVSTASGTDETPRLSCGTNVLDSKDCDVLEKGAGATLVTVPEEPYALHLDPAQDLLYVGHLRGDTAHQDTGGVSLFDVTRPRAGAVASDPDAPKFLNPSRAFFPADPTGSYGVTSLSTSPSGQLYATSRYVPEALGLNLTGNGDDICSEDPTTFGVSPGTLPFSSPLVGSEMRGLAWVSDTRAFALQRIPPALISYEVTQGPFGNIATDFVETCSAPTFLDAAGTGAARRLYVTCFEAGQVYVVDPTIPGVVATIDVGRGPAGLVFDDLDAPTRAYVIGFGHNNIGVIDLVVGSPTQYHVIHKLGFPSVLPR